MARLVEDVLSYLAAQSLVAGATGWAKAAGYLPPSPDLVVAVFETAGAEPELKRPGSTEVEYDEPGFQVRVRGAEHGYAAARDKIGAVYRALHGSDLSPTASGYLLVRAVQSGPLPLGLDESSRPGFTWNFTALRERGGN